MSSSSHSDEQLRQLFREHVREVAAGFVELVALARGSGRLIVAVRSNDDRIHPVSACGGLRGIYMKTISRELGGEKLNIVLWSESLESFILAAIAPYGPTAIKTPKVTLDAAAHQAKVDVNRDTFTYFAGQGERLRLASKLVGWDIQLICHEQN